MSAEQRLDLVVAATSDATPGVRDLVLVPVDGRELASYTPGAHLVVEVPAGPGRPRRLANAYSLTGDNLHPQAYEISVLRCDPDDGGAGGSAWVHELEVGDRLVALPPRSAFAPVRRATRHLLVGAGIGVTPLLSHLRSHARWGHDVEVLLLHREGRGARCDDVGALAGPALTVHHERTAFVAHLRERLLDQPMGTHLYTCGPAGFMDAVLEQAAAAGWPASRLHLEHFGLAALDPGEPFTVAVGDDPALVVPAGTSLLERLEEAGYEVANMCRQGVCGECRVSLGPASTGVWHRDLYLSDDDRAAADCAMACVSRALPDATGRAHLEVLP